LHELDDLEVIAEAEKLRAEVLEKLIGWRQKAAIQALDQLPTSPASYLAQAQKLLDDHTTNVYIKLRFAGRRLLTAATLLVFTIVGLWFGVYRGWFRDPTGGSGPPVLNDPGLFGGVLLLGFFGAMLSLALGLSEDRQTRGRIYELTTAQIAVPVARLSIGGGAAVLAVAAVQATFVRGDLPWLYLAAIPAGFSERLVRRSVEALESATSSA
jgi:hypothetical protein